MTIRVYPSLLPGEPIESHEWDGSVGGWLESNGIDYLNNETQPILVSKNGEVIAVEQWADTHGDVEIRLLPHGSVFKALGSILGKVFNLLFGWLLPGQAGADRNDTPQGQKIDVATAKANQPRLGEVVPELAGRFRRFPDYLTPPRRHFVNRREQWLEFHACIGPGRYQINPADVKVGDTPFSSLGVDGIYQIFDPGVNLSAITTHQNWHTVDEVGGTSSGTAGLELSTEVGNRVNSNPASYDFDGLVINRASGEFPPAWGGLTTVTIEYPRPYSITTETETFGGFPADISEIEGYFGHVDLTIPGTIKIGPRDNEVEYTLHSAVAVGGGIYKIRLMQYAGEPPVLVPVVFTPSPSETLMFGSSVARSIQSMSETSLTLAGPLSFETSTVSGATVAFLGGRVYGEWTSEFVACPGNETSTTFEIDLFFPSGLAYINDDGSLANRTALIEIQYRDVQGGASTTILRTYTDNTLDQIGFTERLSTPSMRAAFRVRRVSAESTSTQIHDTVHWYGLKSRIATVTSYPGWTTMSVQLRSGGRIAAQSENQINVIATRILPTLQSDGSWGPAVPTRDITAFAKYIATTIGYSDDDLRLDEFLRLHQTWASRGDTFDYVYDQTTVRDAMNVAFGAGMAELTVDDGQIKPVRDEPRTQFEQAYSPQNMTRPLSRSFRSVQPDDHDGVEVEYVDGETWTSQTVRCFLPGDAGFKIEKVKIDGVVDRTRAWRIGMRRRRVLRYRRWDYSFATELDALNSGYLSYVPLYDDLPGYGQSSILENISTDSGGALLHVSEPLVWESGASHVVGYRRPDGTIAGPYPASPGADEYSVIANIPQPWPVISLKQEPPHVYFGTAERWTFPALITQIAPQGIESVRVSAVNYDGRVYADDNNSPSQDD
jgi:sulfur carrier protein ThiS